MAPDSQTCMQLTSLLLTIEYEALAFLPVESGWLQQERTQANAWNVRIAMHLLLNVSSLRSIIITNTSRVVC